MGYDVGFFGASALRKTSRNSYQVSHLHMLHDTVRLAQPNRNAKEVAAQKEAIEFVFRPAWIRLTIGYFLTQRFFDLSRRKLREGGSDR